MLRKYKREIKNCNNCRETAETLLSAPKKVFAKVIKKGIRNKMAVML